MRCRAAREQEASCSLQSDADRGEGLRASYAICGQSPCLLEGNEGPLGGRPKVAVSDDTKSGLRLLDGTALLSPDENAIGSTGTSCENQATGVCSLRAILCWVLNSKCLDI